MRPISRDSSYVSYTELSTHKEYPEIYENPLISYAIGASICLLAVASIISTTFYYREMTESSTFIYKQVLVQDFEGWGTSIAWWGAYMGTFDKKTRMEFLDSFFNQTSNDSLRMNIVRYNIGGADLINSNGSSQTPGIFSDYKGIPSFQFPNGTYNWENDQAQLNILLDTKALGVSVFEAFSNSPPYWMTISGMSSGNYGARNNLDPSNYSAFASYLVKVVDHGIREWGIPFSSLEPFNEPKSDWWKPSATGEAQEGCHWDSDNQKEFMPILRKEMARMNLLDKVSISASDDYSIQHGLDFIDDIGLPQLEGVNRTNIHGYSDDFKMENPLKYPEQVFENSNKKIVEYASKIQSNRWMSETGGYGLGDLAVYSLAYDISRHLNLLRAKAWVYWQIMDKVPHWALIITSSRYPWWFSEWNYRPERTISYYVLKQFTHIRPGYKVVSHSRSSMVEFCHICSVVAVKDSSMVIVLLNAMDRKSLHLIDTGEWKSMSPSTKFQVYRTSHWKNENHTELFGEIVYISQNQIKINLEPFSITTIRIS